MSGCATRDCVQHFNGSRGHYGIEDTSISYSRWMTTMTELMRELNDSRINSWRHIHDLPKAG
jgi:hypothetical protein